MDQDTDIHLKIWVTGLTGSGKSYLANKLAEEFQLPLIEMDQLVWKKGWKKETPSRILSQLKEKMKTSTWVLDGGYSFQEEVSIQHSDLICYVRVPWMKNFWQLFSRSVREVKNKHVLWDGNVCSWSRLMSRDSILIYFFQEKRRRRGEARRLKTMARKKQKQFVSGNADELYQYIRSRIRNERFNR